MKRTLSILLTLISLSLSAQKTTSFNAETEAVKIGAINLVNDSTLDQTAALNSIFALCGSRTVHLVAGHKYLYRSTLYGQSYLHIEGNEATLKTDAYFTGDNNDGILFIGKHDVSIRGITFTNNFSKKMNSILRFNSSPGENKNITVSDNQFLNSWVSHAIMLGQTTASETHYIDSFGCENNVAENIYDPLNPILYVETLPICDFIDLEQTTRTAIIRYNTVRNVGRLVFGWGYSQSLPVPANACNWDISYNHVFRAWCAVETNGNHLGYNSTISHNVIEDITWDAGFALSLNGSGLRVFDNKITVCGRGGLEFTGVNARIYNNTIITKNWYPGCGLTAPSVKHTRSDQVNAYGFNNSIFGNTFQIDDMTNRYATIPDELNCIAIIGKNDEPAGLQPESESYKGISDYSTYWKIYKNTCTGFDKHAIYANNNMINNVVVTANTFQSNRVTGDIVQNYGKRWIVSGNYFNTIGAPQPNPYTGYFNVFIKQGDSYFATGSVLGKNTVSGSMKEYVNSRFYSVSQ